MTGKKRDLEKTKPAPPEAAPLLLEDLRRMIEEARQGIAATVNAALTLLYWRVGKRINEEILKGERAEYGAEILATLSQDLVRDYGKGFSYSALTRMLKFSDVFPDRKIVATLSQTLSWSHFCELLPLEKPLQRDFYAEMCRIERWSVRTLRQKIGSMLYERTALSKKPEELARIELDALRNEDKLTPDLVFRDPYFLDFLGLTGAFQEKDLEAAILREMEAFILEIGAGLSFIARQKRITLDGDDFYLDLLFFHRRLRRLVAIELKLDKFRPEHKGQMELYLRWLDKNERQEGEAAPIGMILCAGKKQEQIELLELDGAGIHVAEYLVELPPKELLRKKLHRAIALARERLESRGEDRIAENVAKLLEGRVMRLGNVIKVNPESIRNGYPFNEIEYIDISSVGTGTLQGTQRMKLEDAPSRAKRIFRNSDTLLATVRPNLRAFWFARNPQMNTIASTGFAVLRAGNDIDARFLYYTVTNQPFTDYLTANAKGAAYPAVDTDTIERAEIYLPPLSTQRKIAAILSAYDDLIENNLRRIKILEEMAQNLYREWFVKFRFPGHQHTRFTDSLLGRIPEGWEVDTVENTFSILGGGTPSKTVPEYWDEGTINWYSPTDLTATGTMFMERSGNQISELGLKKSSARLFPPFSVMMTSRATLGVISINTTEACTNQGFITCVPNERFPLYTLYYWLKENVEYFISLGTGATFKEITKGVFKTIELVVPVPAIVTQFEDTAQQFALQVLNLQRKNTILRRTRDLLLPRLISGEVDVSELDIAVPGNSKA